MSWHQAAVDNINKEKNKKGTKTKTAAPVEAHAENNGQPGRAKKGLYSRLWKISYEEVPWKVEL